MALAANFKADFSSFLSAVDKAEVALADFGKGADKVKGQLDRMVDQFQGRAVIQQATLMGAAIEKVGGLSQLSAQQIELVAKSANDAAATMNRLGIEGASSMQQFADRVNNARSFTFDFASAATIASGALAALGINAGLSGIVQFTKGLFEAADNLEKLKDKTGVSVEGLQRFQVVGDDAGNTVDQITNSIEKMENKLAGGDSGAIGALGKLGLSFEDIQKLTPENQFIAISDAIRKIDDPAQQVNIAMALFGKAGAEILPTLKKGFDDVRNSASTMSAETVKAFDDLGDAIAKWWRITKGVTAEAIVGFAHLVEAGFDPNIKAAQDLAREAEVTARQLSEMAKQATILKPKMQILVPDDMAAKFGELSFGIDQSNKAMVKAQEEATKNADAQAKYRNEVLQTVAADKNQVLALENLIPGLVKGTDAFNHVRDAIGGMLDKGLVVPDMLKNWYDANKQVLSVTKDFSGVMATMPNVMSDTADGLHNLASSANEFHDGISIAGNEVGSVTIPLFTTLTKGVLPQMTDQIENAREAADSLGTTIGTDLTDALSKVPDLMIKAFTGGGGLSGAFKAIGTSLTKAIVDPLLSGLSKVQKEAVGAGGAIAGGLGASAGLGSTASAAIAVGTGIAGAALAASAWGASMAAAGVAGTVALGAATAGIGAAAIGVALLIKHYTGLSETIKQARADVEKFQNAMGGVEGTIDTVGKAFARLGLSGDQAQAALKALWDTNAGAAAVDKAIADITDKLQRADVVSGILNGDFKDLLTQGVAMGVTLPTALQATIQQLVDMGVITGDNAKLFAQLSNQTGMDFTKMQELASKYGIQLSDLGPAFQQAHLTDIATSVINDFDTLAKGGANVDAVLAGMKKPINDIVNESIKFGTEIPANMKPWIEQLLKTGQLVDENGDKIDDISGIKFGPVIADQFQIIIDKISALIDVLTKNLPNAINNIPAPAPVHVPISYDDPGRPNGEVHVQIVYDDPGRDAAFAARGGLVTTGGVQYLAGGGRVLPWPSRGSDTVPAMLTPGEGVVSRRGMASLGKLGLAAINRGGGWSDGGSVSVTNNFSVAADIDSPASRDRLRKAVDDATMAALSRQKRFQVA